jgi:hypothetical protein
MPVTFTRRVALPGVRAAVIVVSIGAVFSCQSERPTGIRLPSEASLAKGGGGGGGGGGTTAVSVTSTSPSQAFQDTTLDVTVFGTGFTTGAKATWSLRGDTTQVHVKSTKVVSATELLARIIVPASAAVASYDVVVTLSNGKKGVGAEMFEVLLGNPTATFLIPTDDGALGLRSDQLFVSGASSVYAHGVCGVNSKIFATGAGSGDAIMHTNNPKFSDRKCSAYPRTVTVDYGDGVVETAPVFINVREIANETFQIPEGQSALRILRVNVGGRCDGLAWADQLGNGTNTNGGDRVKVTRVNASTWLVESQPYPDNQAYCVATGQLYHIPVRFTVVSSAPLP